MRVLRPAHPSSTLLDRWPGSITPLLASAGLLGAWLLLAGVVLFIR
jgi:hypothetical protein